MATLRGLLAVGCAKYELKPTGLPHLEAGVALQAAALVHVREQHALHLRGW